MQTGSFNQQLRSQLGKHNEVKVRNSNRRATGISRPVKESGAIRSLLSEPNLMNWQSIQMQLSDAMQDRPQGSRVETPTVIPEKWHPSDGWKFLAHHPTKQQLWVDICQEAKGQAEAEPFLASFLHASIVGHQSLEQAMAFVLANKLHSSTMLTTQLNEIILEAYRTEPELCLSSMADLIAVEERDPACDSYMQCLLFFKGFQAIQAHRIAHYLWLQGRHSLAHAFSSRIAEVFSVDIHPAARIGRGVMMDHATGCVIGETAVVGDNVSMLHGVTLGGSGRSPAYRHPTIGNGVLLGARVNVLGPITVGAGSKIGAGAVVLSDLPEHVVAVGLPAKVVKKGIKEPCKDMDQCKDFMLDFQI